MQDASPSKHAQVVALNTSSDQGLCNRRIPIKRLAYRNALIPLTTGIDAPGEGAFIVSSPSGNAVIGGVLNAPSPFFGNPPSTFTNGDNIQATGLNNTFNIVSQEGSNVAGVNATVSGVQNVKVTAGGEITFNGTGSQAWTGLTSLTTNTNNNAAQNIIVASTTDVNATSTGGVSGDVLVRGGKNVTINSDGQRTVNVGNDGLAPVGNVSVTASSIGTRDVGVLGGTNVTINVSGQTSAGQDLSVINVGLPTFEPTGAVNINATTAAGSVTQGAINVRGGSTVSINQNIGSLSPLSATTYGDVTVNGTANTTAVSVSQNTPVVPGGGPTITNGMVMITDASAANPLVQDTINTVSLSGAGASTINSAALSTLNLSNSVGAVTINNLVPANPGNASTLALNLNGAQSLGGITLAAPVTSSYTTLNLQASGSSELGTIAATGSTIAALNFSGNGFVRVNAQPGLAPTGTITSTSSGGVSLTSPLGVDQGFNGAQSSGGDSIEVGNTNRNINLGNGNNSVAFNSGVITNGSVTVGTGVDNATFPTAAIAATASATPAFASKISGFDRLTIQGASTGETVDLANLDNISFVEKSGIGNITLNNFANNGTLLLTAVSGTSTVSLANPAGTNDTFNYNILTPGNVNLSLIAPGVETFNITSFDNEPAPATINSNQLALTAVNAKTINITGDTNLALTATATTITSLDASALSGATFSWVSGALSAASTIRGSATAQNNIATIAAVAPVTYIGGNGINNFNGGTNNDTITGGASADLLGGGNGKDVINSGGSGSVPDIIVGGAQADLITITGSPNARIENNSAGDSGANTATTTQTSVIATGFDRVIGTTNGVEFTVPSVGAATGQIFNAQTLAGIDDFVTYATGTFASGSFTFNPNGSDTLVTYDVQPGSGGQFESIVLSNFVVGNASTLIGATITLSSLSV